MINTLKQHQDSVRLSARHFFLATLPIAIQVKCCDNGARETPFNSSSTMCQVKRSEIRKLSLSSSQPCRGLNHPGTMIFSSTTVLPEGDSDVWQQNTVEVVMWAARVSSGLKSVTVFCCRTLVNQMKGPCGDLRDELEQTSESTWMNLGSLIHLQVAVT